jgi:hypothetical protein
LVIGSIIRALQGSGWLFPRDVVFTREAADSIFLFIITDVITLSSSCCCYVVTRIIRLVLIACSPRIALRTALKLAYATAMLLALFNLALPAKIITAAQTIIPPK